MSAVVTWAVPTATDNVGVAETISTHNPGDVFDVGTTDVSYTFRDAAGNEAICSFIVSVSAANPNNPCNSSPCPENLSCYYTATQYICLPSTGRRRRDAGSVEAEECQCKNGGVCVSGTNAEVQCQCPAGFAGILCEVRDPCLLNPCANNGTCLDLSLNGESAYMCRCAKGWEGAHCLSATRTEEASAQSDLSPMFDTSFLSMSIMVTIGVLVLVVIILALLVFRMSPRTAYVYNKRADEMPIIN